MAKPRLGQHSVPRLERRRSRSNELSGALQLAGQGPTNSQCHSVPAGQAGYAEENSQIQPRVQAVCSGEVDSRSSRLQVRVQMGRDVAVDQHFYSTAQAGAEGPRLILKWAICRTGGGPGWSRPGPGS